MVIYTCMLTHDELKHYLHCSVVLTRVNASCRLKERNTIIGLKLPHNKNTYYTYKEGCSFRHNKKKYSEIVVNGKVLRIVVEDILKHINKSNKFTTSKKSILKNNSYLNDTPKSVTFNDNIIVTPISPRRNTDYSDESLLTGIPDICKYKTPVTIQNTKKRLFSSRLNNGEFKLSILQSNKKLDRSYIRQFNRKMTTEEEIKHTEDVQKDSITMDVEKQLEAMESGTIIETDIKNITEKEEIKILTVLPEKCVVSDESDKIILDNVKSDKKEIVLLKNEVTKVPIKNNISEKLDKTEIISVEYLKMEVPQKRKRGRPRKYSIDPDPPFNPFITPKKKTYVPPKRPVITDPNEPKRKRGRPRKKIEFGFHNISSEINTINLPTDLWSAHVSVTTKRSQVCFTRVVQVVSDSVPVECDRSVKFIGGKNYYIKMNNRLVELVGAPKTVESLRDVEVLLEIVNELDINDPILRYYVR